VLHTGHRIASHIQHQGILTAPVACKFTGSRYIEADEHVLRCLIAEYLAAELVILSTPVI
jgi:hypothetical protein